MDESFGAMLRPLRLAASLTQEALAERAAVSATAIAALERGRRRAPRLSTLRQLGRALDLDAEQLALLAQIAQADQLSALHASSGGSGAAPDDRSSKRPARGHRKDATRVRARATPCRRAAFEPRLRGGTVGTLRRRGARRLSPFRRGVAGARTSRSRNRTTPPVRGGCSAARLLGAFAPELVVVDDLHWADEAPLVLLGYLVRDRSLASVTLVATTREIELDPRRAARLASLEREAEVTRIRLAAMDDGDLALLLGELIGTRVGSGLVHSVGSVAEGNPLFAEEMTVHLIDSGRVVEEGGEASLSGDADSAGVPALVRETLAGRLFVLPPDTTELMLVGSVIGREFDLSLAASVAGLDGSRLVDATDDGLLSGLLAETEPGRVAFSHALVRRGVVDRLSYTRAASIHRRIATEMEARAEDEASVAAELGRHWGAVAEVDPSPATVAATWAVRAGDVALAAAAADEAIARYEGASMLWASASHGHADALIRLGTALASRGRADEADSRFREALRLGSALGERRLEARAAIGLGRRFPYWESDSDRIGALEAALRRLPAEEELLRLTLMGLLGTQLINRFQPHEAERRDELADQVAAEADDPETSEEILAAIGQTRVYDCVEDPERLARVALRLSGVGVKRNDLRVLAVARLSEALSALDLGAIVDLQGASIRYEEVAARLGDSREKSQAATVRSTIALIQGRYDDAATLSEEALALGKASGDYNAELVFYAQGLLRAVDLGQAADVLPQLREASDYQHIASFSAGMALCAALAGERGIAEELLDRQVSAGFAGFPRGADRLAPTAFLAHTCSILEATRHALVLIDAIASQPAVTVRVGPLVGWWGPVDHHLGTLAFVLGRLDEAEERLGRALALSEAMGALPFVARTRGALARVVLARGDESLAEALRSAALDTARSIGALGVVMEVGAGRPAPSGSGTTPRVSAAGPTEGGGPT